MEGVRRGVLLTAAALFFAAAMLPEAAAVRYLVGGNKGWSQSENYSIWAQDKKFYDGDWLFFVYNRYQTNVLEVNKTDYETCNSDHPLRNWTTGAGRDVVPLNETKTFYFISGNGFCFGGMKVAIHVLNPPPPPSSSPIKSSSPPSLPATFGSRVFVPALLTLAAAWDALLLVL